VATVAALAGSLYDKKAAPGRWTGKQGNTRPWNDMAFPTSFDLIQIIGFWSLYFIHPFPLNIHPQGLGHIREGIDDDIAFRVGGGVRRTGGAPFVGAANEGGFKSIGPGAIQIKIMAGDHTDFAGVQL
jgi:hypothetical protein